MELFTMPRGGGKTHAILRWVAADPEHRVVVVATQMEARTFAERLTGEYDVPIEVARRAAVDTHSTQQLRGRRVSVAVDDVDRVLMTLLGWPVAMGTLT